MGPRPVVAEVRRAVREAVGDVPAGALVLVACSGGADSLALAAALAFVAPRAGLRGGLVTVDHGLQEGSARQAAEVVRVAGELGLEPAEVLTVTVGRDGGPEAAARRARYAALDEAAERLGAAAVLLGHTLDDQAETVLLRLARGSGVRSLSGMAEVAGRYRRPFLGITRATTAAACEALGLRPWEDPHNADARYTRVRVRSRLLPALEEELGPGVAEALARTARLCREDADALDAWAESAYQNVQADSAISEKLGPLPEGSVVLDIAAMGDLPVAVRRRVLRRAAVAAGASAGALGASHVLQIDRLVVEWRGQRGVDLPGGVAASRRYGTLILARGRP